MPLVVDEVDTSMSTGKPVVVNDPKIAPASLPAPEMTAEPPPNTGMVNHPANPDAAPAESAPLEPAPKPEGQGTP